MVKKWGRESFYLPCNYSCTLYFLVRILLIKLKNLYFSALTNLNYDTANKEKCEGCKDGGISQNL